MRRLSYSAFNKISLSILKWNPKSSTGTIHFEQVAIPFRGKKLAHSAKQGSEGTMGWMLQSNSGYWRKHIRDESFLFNLARLLPIRPNTRKKCECGPSVIPYEISVLNSCEPKSLRGKTYYGLSRNASFGAGVRGELGK